MNKKIPSQKSGFPRAWKRIIFHTVWLSAGLWASCNVAAGEKPSIQQQKREAIRAANVALNQPVDSIVVYKSRREMLVFHKQKKLKTYIISLGVAPEGKKRIQGDYKTPEGLYTIYDKNPNSIYHKNLGISYPNNADRKYAREQGIATGGDVKIHGLPNNPKYKKEAYLYSDWTWGCIAVSNEEIDELYDHVAPGTVINILP